MAAPPDGWPRPARWANIAAHLVPLLLIPCCLWRLALGLGVPMGFHGQMARMYEGPGWVTLYVIVLSVSSEALAALTLGLVRPWGEIFPAWIPGLGAKRVPVAAAAAVALVGAAAVTYLTISVAVNWNGPNFLGNPEAPHGFAGLLMTAVYAPLLAWGPLLAAVAIEYLLRHQHRGAAPEITHGGTAHV